MKKTLLAVAVAAGAVILVSPKIIASKFDSQINQVMNSINDFPGYTASIVNTKEGWFNTSTTLRLAFDVAQMDPSMANQSPEVMEMFEDLNIDVLVDMQHGPILLNKGLGLSDIRVSVPNTSDDVKNGDTRVENIYLFDGKIGLFGDLSYTDSFSAMQMPIAGGEGEFVFSGYQGSGETVDGNINYAGSSSSIEVISQGMNFKMGDITANWEGQFDLVKMMEGIYGDSKTNFIIGNFEASQAAQTLFAWEDFELFVNTSVDDSNLMDMHGGYRVTALDTPIEQFKDIEIIFELNNLDQQFTKTYYELVVPMQHPDADPEALLNSLKQPAIKFLSYEPEFKINNIGFSTAAGTLKSNATVKLAEYSIDESQLEDPNFWQNNVLLNSGIDLPKGLALDLLQKNIMMQLQADPGAAGYTPEQLQELAVQQAQMTLNNFLQGGFITENNGQLQLAFNVANGMGNLNGNQIPLEDLLPAQQ